MAAGDQQDVVTRLRAALPGGWFPDVAPTLTAVLSGFAAGFSRVYGLLAFAKLQSRIATASGIWLDGIALDLFGTRLARRAGQSDAALAARITAEVLRPRGTRQSIVTVLTNLTGRAPVVFEPARVQDTGGYDVAAGYAVAGAYGSLALPFQVFVSAHRPAVAGNVSGGGYGSAIGRNVGGGQYLQLASVTGGVTDADIYAAVAGVMPAAATAWVRIAA